jgi:nucleoside-diphosphate kinase
LCLWLTLRIKSLTPSPALAKEHYIDLASRPFYGGLVKYITSGTPVVAM